MIQGKLPPIVPLKHTRYDRNLMTVCIAAICKDGDDPRFVLCADQRIETDQAGGNVCLKLDHAGDGWWAMIAGNTARARDLVAACRRGIMDRTHTMEDSAEFKNKISECVHAQQRALVNEFVESQLAMTYDYFLRHGRSQLPGRHVEDVVTGIRSVNLGCQVILAGFIGQNPFLFTIDLCGTVYREESFAVIGTGTQAAQASLFRRNFRGYINIHEAAYYLYEAKKFSEVSPGVGATTDMALIAPSLKPGGSRWKMVSPFYKARLEQEYKDFGPKDYVPRSWPDLMPGLRFTEERLLPEATMDDSQSPPALPELPEESGES